MIHTIILGKISIKWYRPYERPQSFTVDLNRIIFKTINVIDFIKTKGWDANIKALSVAPNNISCLTTLHAKFSSAVGSGAAPSHRLKTVVENHIYIYIGTWR